MNNTSEPSDIEKGSSLKGGEYEKRRISGIAKVHVKLNERKVKVTYKDIEVFKSFITDK